MGRALAMAGWVALAAAAQAAEESDRPAELHSSLKGTFLLTRAREVGLLSPDEVGVASLWRLRFEPKARISSWLTVSGAWEQRVRVASSATALASPGLPPGEEEAPWRVVPLAGAAASGSTWAYWHEIDRLAVALHLPWVELTVGRQALGWGRGVLFGAIDLFAPFTPLEVDREFRRGVDAVRAEVRLGPKASLDAVGVFGDALDKSAVAGRLRGYLGPVDAELVGGWRARDWFAGLAASASVFDAELHGELAAFVLPEDWQWGSTFGNRRVLLKAVVGASYQFPVGEGLRAIVEYHYNGFGLAFPVSVLELAADPAVATRLARGDFQTLGRHLLALGASYTFELTLGASLQALVDPSDGSGLLAPSLTWDVAENVTLVAGGYVGWGRLPEDFVLRSQLGATPVTVLIQLRVYDLRAVEPAEGPDSAPLEGSGSSAAGAAR